MPAVNSKPTNSNKPSTHIFKVVRPEHTFAVEFDCTMTDAPRISRAFSDACDLVIMMSKTDIVKSLNDYPDSIVFNWDMKKFRKVCRHKGDEEESLMCNFIQAVSPGVGLKVNEIGFPLDAKGKVTNDDVLKISVSKFDIEKNAD